MRDPKEDFKIPPGGTMILLVFMAVFIAIGIGIGYLIF